MGFASSARRRDAVSGEASCGITDMNWPVCEASESRREVRPGDWPDWLGRGRDGDGDGDGYWLECFFPLTLGGVDTIG